MTTPGKRLGNPFDPAKKGFAENIRAAGDLTELRESMRENGWVDDPAFYAVKDEHGVILMGHRRLDVAQQLGIEARVRIVQCGNGDAGDIKRFQLAVLSNIGHKAMTKAERQNVVKVLAGPDHDWTQMSVAKALGVAQGTVAKDVAALEDSGEIIPRNKKPGRGRPPKSPDERKVEREPRPQPKPQPKPQPQPKPRPKPEPEPPQPQPDSPTDEHKEDDFWDFLESWDFLEEDLDHDTPMWWQELCANSIASVYMTLYQHIKQQREADTHEGITLTLDYMQAEGTMGILMRRIQTFAANVEGASPTPFRPRPGGLR